MKFVTPALALVALASCVQAVTVSTPSDFSTAGPNTIEFTTVSTDPTTASVVLVNQDTTILATPIVLFKNTSLASSPLTLAECAITGLKSGSGWRINFLREENNFNTIAAQSGLFNITASTESCSATASTSASVSASKSASASASKSGAASASAAAASASAATSTSAAFPSLDQRHAVFAAGLIALGAAAGLA